MSNPVRTAFQVILFTFVMATLCEAQERGPRISADEILEGREGDKIAVESLGDRLIS